MEGELGGLTGDIKDDRSTGQRLWVKADKVDIVPVDDGCEKRHVEVDREFRQCDRNPVSRRKRRPMIRRE